MIIYNQAGAVKYDIEVNEATTMTKGIDGTNKINAVFTTKQYADIIIGDFVLWRSTKYILVNEPSVLKNKTNEYRYNVDFLSEKFQFNKAIVRLDDVTMKTSFYFYGTLQDHVNLILTNINRILDQTYTAGTIPTTSPKNFYYDNVKALEALNGLASTFEKEYDLNGTVLNFADTIGTQTTLSFQFMKGLRNIERKKLKDNELTTRLYAYGSEKNLTSAYIVENNSKRLKISPIEHNTQTYGIIEGVRVFEEVYPQREGTVTSEGSTHFFFSDSGMPFDINDTNVLIPGQLAKLSFNTGDLTGYEFEILKYNSITKEFELKQYDDANGLLLPNATFKPRTGDKYVIYGINLPQVYIDNAKAELQRKAEELILKISYPTVIYEVKPDITHIRENAIELNIGDTVNIFDADLGINIESRITELTQTLADPHNYVFKIGNKTKDAFIRQISAKTTTTESNLNSSVSNLNVKINQITNKTEILNQAAGTVGNNLLLPETKGQNFAPIDLRAKVNYQGDQNDVFFEGCRFSHFTIEATPKTWTIPSGLRTMSQTTADYYIYLVCSKATNVGEFQVNETILKTDTGSENYYFLIGSISKSNGESRTLNLMFNGGSSEIVSGGETADSIKQKYESNPDTNAFTDAEKAKLAAIGLGGNDTTILFGDYHHFKGEGNSTPGTLQKNDIIVIRWTNDQLVWLLYDGVGNQNTIGSYKVLNKYKITLYP